MNRGYLTAIVLIFAATTAQAQRPGSFWDRVWSTPDYSVGLHTGIDIGGAVPFPPGKMGPDAKMTATPTLYPALGASVSAHFADRWSMSLETTYKQVGIDAKAWVSGQGYTDRDNKDLKLNFRGTVDVSMKFSMLEIPLYCGYRVGRKNNRAVLGVFYSKVFQGRFSSTPIKGVLTNANEPDSEPAAVTPDNPYTQDFDQDLDNWDTGFLVGYEWQVIPKVMLAARFSMGLKDIFKAGNNYLDYRMLHMRGSVVLSYRILGQR